MNPRSSAKSTVPVAQAPAWIRARGRLARYGAILAVLTLIRVAPWAYPATTGCTSPTSPEATAVHVTAQREGCDTHFIVENNEYCEVTMTFDMKVQNLTAGHPLPYTVTVPPRQVTEVFTLSPVDPSAQWEYSYTNYYKLGSNCAQHDDSYLYQLPYEPGTKFKVTQGYNGKFSHIGANQYAIDWQMPEGTLVYAARGGIVVRVKSDSDRGGSSMDYDRYNNYVLVRHADGTLGHYCHLQKGGCLVKVGQTVATGQAIAHSGNTGFSSGPHLHFCVFKTKNGRERISLPIQFRTSDRNGITLTAGHTYRAAEQQSASAKAAIATRSPALPVRYP